MAFSGEDTSNKVAPWYSIPVDPVMSVEHPCIVKNNMKGIDMLGGSRTISQVLDAGTEKTLPLFFKPQDPSSRSVLSLHNETSNVLLKVTVPKRTGQKRKRGTTDDFVEDLTASEPKHDAAYLVRSMADNKGKYSIEPVGNINTTHIWRNMPDFVYSTQGSTFMKNVERQVLPLNYSLLKKYSLPRTYGLEDTETIPPPVLSTQSLPQHYMYRENPAALAVADPATGTKSMLIRTQILKTHTLQWAYDATVPTVPEDNCPPIEQQPENVQELVRHLKELFEKRPIWTRRAMHNCLPEGISFFMTRYALAYVAYTVRSGPWRDALVRYGLDPRSDPQYRIYQTVLLQLTPKDKASTVDGEAFARQWTRNIDRQSHVFDGIKSVPKDGKVWQLCDLEDEQLKTLVNVPDLFLRPECEIRYFGWYQAGTLAKIRVALKAKIDALLENRALDTEAMNAFLSLPEQYNPSASDRTITGFLPGGLNRHAYDWAGAYRSMCGTPAGAVPVFGSNGKGRHSLSKPKARPSYLDVAAAESRVNTQLAGEHQAQEDTEMQDNQDGDLVAMSDEYAEPAEDENEDETENEIEDDNEEEIGDENGDEEQDIVEGVDNVIENDTEVAD